MQGINFGFSYFWASTLGFSNSGHQLWYFLQNFSDFFRGINFCSYLYKSFFPKLGLNWPTQRQLLHPSVNCYLTDYDSNMKSANTRGFFKDLFERSFGKILSLKFSQLLLARPGLVSWRVRNAFSDR